MEEKITKRILHGEKKENTCCKLKGREINGYLRLPSKLFNPLNKKIKNRSFVQEFRIWTSSQDGGVGRHTAPHCTTKRRTTTNLKTKNNQNWQKIELHGISTTKESKKKHSSRRVGGVETGSQAGRTRGKEGLVARQRLEGPAVPHLRADKPSGPTREQDRLHNPGFQCRETKPQRLLTKNSCGD